MANTTASNEETLKFDLYISNTEEDTFKLEDLPEYTFNSVSVLRSEITSMVVETLTEGAKDPKLLKIVGGVLADSPLTAVGIAMSINEEGLMQATITGITATAVATTIGVVVITPAIAGLGLSAGAAFSVGLVATWLVNVLADKGVDWLYERAEEKLGEFLYNEDSKTVTINTDLADINDINSLLEPIYQCSIEESDNIKDIVVNQDVNGEENTYVIKPGDTVWALAQRYGLTPEEMVELNPWLGDRFSDDGSYALIRPGEHLLIPGGKSPIVQKLGDTFTEAEEVIVPRDPLLIDLDGDGIETTTVENGVYFDHESDGFADWCKNVPRICHG